MYTTITATREQGLVAAAAAERAMERYACCKSQFKFKCFACGEMINRGDKITHCHRQPTGMTLRYRGADSRNGLNWDEIIFYQGSSGNNMWVHIGCIPCYWDQGLDQDGKRLTRPRLRPICTEWGAKVYGEFEEWCGSEDCDTEALPHFRLMKGYPKEKLMFDRIIHAVKRFQAIWRGYLYKKAYPEALRAAKATGAINLNARIHVCDARCTHFSERRVRKYRAASPRLSPGEGWREGRKYRAEVQAEAMFYCHNKDRVGTNSAILFDRGKKNEAIYSCEIVQISGESNGVQVYVRFHYDEERRKYHWKKFELLERECQNFMTDRGMLLLEFVGKIRTHPRFWNRPD